MTDAVIGDRPGVVPLSPARGILVFAGVLAVSLALAGWGAAILPDALVELPRSWRLPFDRWINEAMDWLVDEASFGLFTFKDMTRAVSAILSVPFSAATTLLSTGLMSGQGSDAVQLLPPLPWPALVLGAAILGHWAGGIRLAIIVGTCFLYLAVFGQWESAMTTLSSVIIAVPIGGLLGLAIGIAAFRHPRFERAISPVLDLMQTVPVFAYLVPMLVLFGFGPVSAMIATVIYATPPMVRISILALRAVRPDVVEFARMAGCTDRQLMIWVMLPAALPTLMVGVNQVIMLSLNMVIIASMIGAGGLGFDVLSSLRRLDIGGGFESGVAIVVLAIALDRASAAIAARAQVPERLRHRSFAARHAHAIAAAFVVAASWAAAFLVPAVATYPDGWTLTVGTLFESAVRWINVNFFDWLEAVRVTVLQTVLVPVKRFLLALPWIWVVLLVVVAAWRLAGPKLAAVSGVLSLLVAFSGLWAPAMTTIYLCGVSVAIASLIGIAIGIASARNDRVWRTVQAVIDVLQTLPSFVYLIPFVMLFRVGDFTAMIAVIAFAISPAIRYTAEGLRRVDPALIEAGVAMGCTRGQILRRIELPLALPEILLGINQTVMLGLSMLVITALVGTRDLGQEVYKALTRADVGEGLVAGLAVAFIAIIADRMIGAASRRLREQLGLGG